MGEGGSRPVSVGSQQSQEGAVQGSRPGTSQSYAEDFDGGGPSRPDSQRRPGSEQGGDNIQSLEGGSGPVSVGSRQSQEGDAQRSRPESSQSYREDFDGGGPSRPDSQRRPGSEQGGDNIQSLEGGSGPVSVGSRQSQEGDAQRSRPESSQSYREDFDGGGPSRPDSQRRP
eukprot:114669_1